ncbi:MAG: hypothetical protein ACM359_09745 [Bacillota bacterium]
MSGMEYTVAAYAVGLGLMVAYGLRLWLESRAVQRRGRGEGEK